MNKLAIRKRSRLAAAAAAIGLAVAATGCATDPETSDGSRAPGQGNPQSNQQETEDVTLVIDQPQAGETVTLPFEVVASADVQLGTISSGAPHMHVWFDDAMDQMMIVEGDSDLILDAPDGATVLRVQVHSHDHQPMSEVVEVPITVEGGNGGSRPGPGNDY